MRSVVGKTITGIYFKVLLHNASTLYISACSSEETIAFYKAMGAKLTENPIHEIADEEPCDLQMRVEINNSLYV